MTGRTFRVERRMTPDHIKVIAEGLTTSEDVLSAISDDIGRLSTIYLWQNIDAVMDDLQRNSLTADPGVPPKYRVIREFTTQSQ